MNLDVPVIEIAELSTRHEELLTRLRAGEGVVLTDQGRRIGTVSPNPTPSNAPVFDSFKGQVWIAEDFDAPLPAEILAEFHK